MTTQEEKTTLPEGISEEEFRNLLLNFLDKEHYYKALRKNTKYRLLLKDHKLAVANVRKAEEKRNELWMDICKIRVHTWDLVTQYRKEVQ